MAKPSKSTNKNSNTKIADLQKRIKELEAQNIELTNQITVKKAKKSGFWRSLAVTFFYNTKHSYISTI